MKAQKIKEEDLNRKSEEMTDKENRFYHFMMEATNKLRL